MELKQEALDRAFPNEEFSFEEYRNQEVIDTNDGEFFDALDEAFGIVPGTDEIAEKE